MVLVICDDSIHSVWQSRNLWEVSFRETFTAWAPDQIICGMLVSIGCFFAVAFHHFKDGVHPQTLVRVDWGAVSIDLSPGKVCRIDATGEKQGRIIVDILGIRD